MRRMHHLSSDATSERRQTELFPHEPKTSAGQATRNTVHGCRGRKRLQRLPIAFLHRERKLNALGRCECRDEPLEVSRNSRTVCGNRGAIEKDARHGGQAYGLPGASSARSAGTGVAGAAAGAAGAAT